MGTKQSRTFDVDGYDPAGLAYGQMRDADTPPPYSVANTKGAADGVEFSYLIFNQPIELLLRSAYAEYASNGRLQMTGYQNALRRLESLGLRRMRDTPLGNRLFRIFDVGNKQFISEDEFVLGVNTLLRGSDAQRIDITYKVYASKSGSVTIGDVLNFVSNTWLCAFWFLSEQIKNNSKDGAVIPTAEELDEIALREEPQLRTTVLNSLMLHLNDSISASSFDSNPSVNLAEYINFPVDKAWFASWAAKDRPVTVTWNSFRMQVASTLVNINKLATSPNHFD